MYLVERRQVVVLVVLEILLILDVVRHVLQVIDVHKVLVLVEEFIVLLSVGKRVIADGELLVAELLVQLDPVEKHDVVVVECRVAEEVAVGAEHGALFDFVLAALDLHLDRIVSSQVSVRVEYVQADLEVVRHRDAVRHGHVVSELEFAHQVKIEIERRVLDLAARVMVQLGHVAEQQAVKVVLVLDDELEVVCGVRLVGDEVLLLGEKVDTHERTIDKVVGHGATEEVELVELLPLGIALLE